MAELGYLRFLFMFLVLPITALLLFSRWKKDSFQSSPLFNPIVAVIVLAVIYTTPWDNYMIQKGVWSYGKDVVILSILYAPLEEYIFFILQPLLTGLFFHSFLSVEGVSAPSISWSKALLGLLSGVLVSVLGFFLLNSEPTFYMGSILLWAGPVLAIQWTGWRYLIQNAKNLFLGVLVPTVYLSVVDMYAIHEGIWIISERFTTGVMIANLPIEEALFFFTTNIFILQALILYHSYSESKIFDKYFEEVLSWR